MLNQYLLTIVQHLVYYAVAVSTAVQNRATKTMSIALLLRNNWWKRSPTFKPSSTSLLLISSGLTWASSTTSLLLISHGPAKVSNFFVRVQLTSLLLISRGPAKVSNFFVRVQLTSLLLISPGLVAILLPGFFTKDVFPSSFLFCTWY